MGFLTSMSADYRKEDAPYDILLLTAGFLVLFMFGLRTISGGDIWLHLSAGRHAVLNGAATIDPFSFSLPPGTAWLQTTWLYDIMIFKMWQVGRGALIVLAHAFAVVGSFLILLPLCRKYSGQIHQAVAVLLAAWLIAPLFTIRPLLFCLLFIAVQINLLSRDRITVGAAALLIVNQLIWANMHISFLLGIGLAIVRAWEAVNKRKKQTAETPDTQSPPLHLAVLAAILAAVSLINPSGHHLFGKAIEVVTRPEGSIILEWVSMFHGDFIPLPTGYITTLTLILIASVFIFYRNRLPGVPTFCAIISAFLLVRSKLSVDICALLAFPFIAISLATITSFSSRVTSDKVRAWIPRGIYIAVALLCAYSAWMVMTNRYYIATGSASAFGLRVNSDAYPVGALLYIDEKHGLPARTLNVAHDGGFMIWRRPDEKVFSDPRGDLYGGLFFRRLAKGLLGNDLQWKDLMTLYDPEGILLNATWTGAGTVVYHLINRGDWVISYFDGTSVLLVRKTASNRELMEDTEMQKKGLALIDASFSRYRKSLNNRIIRPPNPSRLIGAATVLQALGRHEESLSIFTALTEGSPRMVTAWVNRGVAEMALNQPANAIRSLTYSLDLVPANPVALLWLSEAYKKEGREHEAALAVNKARDINPDIVNMFNKEQEAAIFQPPAE